MKLLQTILFLFFFANVASSQYDHQAVLPGLEGEDLLSALVDQYKTASTFSYGEARDTLYGVVYNVNDSVSCSYTNYTLYLEPGADPTDFLFMNDNNNGINTEHIYPQSKGAGNGNAKSDMHHLFPCRGLVNSSRGSDRFAEIPDESTLKWFYRGEEMNTIPSNRDLYTEDDNEKFEPRESIKGNVARAMFYFYTMYKNEADSADDEYFEWQRETLCAWHDLDPVDQLEWERTFKIAGYQNDKPNPYVLDCTLAGRTFCDLVSEACKIVPSNNPIKEKTFKVSPNPSVDLVTINPPDNASYDYYISYELGRYRKLAMKHQGPLVIENLCQGFYYLVIYQDGKRVKVEKLQSF